MHPEAYRFVEWVSRAVPVCDCAHVLEIGSLNINGSPRALFPSSYYVGIDRVPGPDVDYVQDAGIPLREWSKGLVREEDDRAEMLEHRVLCMEVLEHTPQGPAICENAWHLLRPGGLFVVTAAGEGRKPHSAVDGGELRAGEYYQNVTRDALRAWLQYFDPVLIDTWSNPGDIYAMAWKRLV